jgi:hypothetical protein
MTNLNPTNNGKVGKAERAKNTWTLRLLRIKKERETAKRRNKRRRIEMKLYIMITKLEK